MRRISLTLNFLLLVPALTFGQDNLPKAEKIEYFGVANCEYLRALSAHFASQISADPASKGLVVVHSAKDRLKLVHGQFRQILALFADYRAEDRVEFLIGDDKNEPSWEFWKIPAGATEPDFRGEKWSLPQPDLTKPFIYDYEDENGICSTFVIRKYAELFIRNPGSRAHIVIRKGQMGSVAKGFADEWLKELTTTYSISKNRIKVFYVRGDNPLTYAEFWFVPSKKR